MKFERSCVKSARSSTDPPRISGLLHLVETGAVSATIWVVAIIVVGILLRRQCRRRGRQGAGGAGSVYDMLNQDRRNALEIIVEERAGARDPEDRDGNLPDLEAPKRR